MSNIDKLLYIDGLGEITQNLNIGGNLNVDNINEKTSNTGVTIEGVILKNNKLNVGTATNFNSFDTILLEQSGLAQMTLSSTGSGNNDVPQINLNKTGVVRANLKLDSSNRLIINSTQSNRISVNDVNIVNISNDNVDINANLNVTNNINLTNNLNVNKINGYSNANNIEIGSYIDITGQYFNAHTITAQNYAVGNTNFISASRQGNFRDVEVKNTNNSDTILLTGDGGHISLEGTLSVDNINEKTSNNGITIDSVSIKNNNVTAHTITAQNYAVGSTNFISASRQGNFRDVEVKNTNNSDTILLTGDGGHISLEGTLSVDNINEKTGNNGVTIEGVILKDNNLNVSGIGTITTLNSTNITGNLTGNVTGNVTGDVTGNITGDVTGNVTGSVTGNVTGDVTGDVTGNASTATTLETARNIGGVSFDGSANIDLSVSNGLISSTNNRTIEIAVSTSPTINISDTMTIYNGSGNSILRIESGNNDGYEPQLKFKNNGVDRAHIQFSTLNNKLDLISTKALHLKAYSNAGRITLDNGFVDILASNNSIIRVDNTDINMNRDILASGRLNIGTATSFNSFDTILLEQSGLAQMTLSSTGSGNNDVPQINLNRTGVVRANLRLDSSNRLIINTTESNRISINDVNIVNISNDNVEIDANLNVYGNLNVTGNINQINSEQINVLDKNIVLASNNNNNNYINDAGLILKSSTDKTFLYNSIDNSWESNINIKSNVTGNLTGNVTGNVTGDVTGNVTGDVTGDVTGNLTGDVTGDVTGNVTGNLTGNASTATTLQTARNIGGVSFDGSADIDLSVSNGLISSTNNRTIEIAVSTTPTINVNTAMTIQNSTGHCNLNIESGNANAYQSAVYWKNNGQERARMLYSSDNNKWDCLTLAGAIHFKAYKDTNDGTSRMLLDNGTFQLQCGSASVLLTDIIRGSLTAVDIYKDTDFNNNDITNVNTLNGYSISADIGGITAGSNLNKSGTTINLDTSLTGITNINSTTISQKLIIDDNSATLGGVLKLLKGTTTSYDVHDWEILNDAPDSSNRYLIFRALANGSLSQHDFMEIGIVGTSKKIVGNATLLVRPDGTNKVLEVYSSGVDIDQQLNISTNGINNNSNLNLKVNNSNILSLFSNRVEIYKDTDMNNFAINFKTDSAANGIVMDSGGVYTNIKGSTRFKPDGTNNVIQIDTTKVELSQELDMNGNRITFKYDDDYQYIKYTAVSGEIDGLEYHGVGSGQTSVAHRFKAGYPNSASVLEIKPEAVEIYTDIDMNNNGIFFQTDNPNHHIKYDGTNGNGLFYSGGGAGGGFAHRFYTTNESGSEILSMYDDKVDIKKKTRITTDGGADLQIIAGTSTSHQPRIQFYQNNDEKGIMRYVPDGDIFEIRQMNTSTKLRLGTYGSSNGIDNKAIDIDDTEINMYLPLRMNQKIIYLREGTNNNHYIKFDDSTGINGVEISGYGWNSQRVFRLVSQGGGGELFNAYNDRINFKKNVWMNTNAINFWNESDENHQIKHSFDTDPVNMNGILIKAYGNTDAFCRFQSSAGGTFTVMDLFKQKISMYKPLYMNSQAIYFQPNDLNHYIKYSNQNNMDGVEIAGYGGSADQYNRALLRVKSSRTDDVNMECFPQDPANTNPTNTNPNVGRTTHIYNKLSVLKGVATGQNDGNDILTVRNTEFCKAIIHSDNKDVELALKCGSSNSNQAVIKRFTNDTFLINNIGQFRVEVGNNTCNFVNNNGTFSWQSDGNLVIYNSGGGSVWASGTNLTSERRFKDNIVSLDLENSYNIIKQLHPVSFVYKEDPNTPKKGFIVDEIEDKIPECIKEITNCECKDKSSKLLYKEDIVPDLVASVKYLISKVETLESTISTLTQQLTTQSTLISNLQSQIDSN